MKKLKIVSRSIVMLVLVLPIWAHAATKPNVVMIVMDNLGWGEVGAYGGGILRGAATPNIDSIADDGLKLLNSTRTLFSSQEISH